MPVVPLEMAAYSRKENWGASETFYHLVRAVLSSQRDSGEEKTDQDVSNRRRSVNLLVPVSWGFGVETMFKKLHGFCSRSVST